MMTGEIMFHNRLIKVESDVRVDDRWSKYGARRCPVWKSQSSQPHIQENFMDKID